jgi:glycolate oxidase FAD binding subunit
MTASCDRDPRPSDAVAGVPPRRVFEPSSQAQCVEVFATARARRLSLAVVGGGTELGLGAPPVKLDAVVSARRLDRIVEYAPSDQVIVVEAGVTLSALQTEVGKHAQRLACDPPLGERATMGGLLSTNNFGPLRTRFGSLRDLVIGVSLVRADATVARGGGKVVKNVAGFDLPKLAVGALGTLGMIATATFRLHPRPEADTTLRFRGLDASGVRSLVLAMRRERLEPAAVVALKSGTTFDLLIRMEGFRDGVREQRGRAVERLGARADDLSPAHAAAAWEEHDLLRTRGSARVKVACLPSDLERLASNVLPPLTDVLSGAAVIAYPTLGLFFVTGDAEDGPAFASAVAGARTSMAGAHGSLVVHDAPASARPGSEPWGPLPPAFSLMKRLKARFDPESRLNPGRFVGGL